MILLSVTYALNVKMDPESVSPFNPMLDFIILFWALLELVLVPPQPTPKTSLISHFPFIVCMSVCQTYLPHPLPLI